MDKENILGILPAVFERAAGSNPKGQEQGEASVLWALLECMENQHEHPEQVLANFDSNLDPRCAPNEFVSYLANWVDLNHLSLNEQSSRSNYRFSHQAEAKFGESFLSGNGRLRELISCATDLSKWRGTRRGLIRFLEVATGYFEYEIEEQAFHLIVHAPAASRKFRLLIEKIIEQEKPVHATHELRFSE